MTRHQWAIAGTAAAALTATGIATRSAVRRIRGDLADIRSIVVCEAAWLRDLADTVDGIRRHPHQGDAVRLAAVPKVAKCVHCAEPILLDDPVIELAYDELRHANPCEQWRPRGPVSDGTLRCPESHNGQPCQKKIPEGWHENEGHPGGHWFQDAASYALLDRGHYDARALVAGEDAAIHAPEDCPAAPGEPCPLKPWDRPKEVHGG